MLLVESANLQLLIRDVVRHLALQYFVSRARDERESIIVEGYTWQIGVPAYKFPVNHPKEDHVHYTMNYVLPAHLQDGCTFTIEQPSADTEGLMTYTESHITQGPFGGYLVQTCDDAGFGIGLYIFNLEQPVTLTTLVDMACPMLMYVVEGSVDLCFPGKDKLVLSHGACYLVYIPKGFHSLAIASGKSILIQLELTTEMIGSLSHKYYEMYAVSNYVWEEHAEGMLIDWTPLYNKVWEAVYTMVFTKKDEGERGVFQYARTLDLLLLYAEELNKRDTRPPCKYRFSPDDIERIIRAGNLKLGELDEQLTLQQLCKEANMHERKLEAGILHVFGKSVKELATEARLEKAKVLLRDTDQTITQIAYTVGYHRSALARAFREVYNMTPSEYREQTPGTSPGAVEN